MPERGEEGNRLSRRARRYARVGAGLGGVALRLAGARMRGREDVARAAQVQAVLGTLKGPVMKVAQMLATIPEALPESFTEELLTLQSQAPSMGWAFVRRRMRVELGPDWQSRFASFESRAAAAASLGQVHRATAPDGTALACKLQYPDMDSTVEADLNQLKLLFSLHRFFDGAIDTRGVVEEIGARLREELDYRREARHMALYEAILSPVGGIAVPRVHPALSTHRLLTMDWLDGVPVLSFRDSDLETRNAVARALFQAWWVPLARYGVIHGDPHLGNYTVRPQDLTLNLFDYGCVRIFPPSFVAGIVDLYRALQRRDEEAMAAAYEAWGFSSLSRDLIETLNIWAHFIYGPLLDDRVRSIADGVPPGRYGRRELAEVQRRLRVLGPVRPPREFVFLERAAIGLGAVFLHLGAEMNFHALFEQAIAGFDVAALARRQKDALVKAGLA